MSIRILPVRPIRPIQLPKIRGGLGLLMAALALTVSGCTKPSLARVPRFGVGAARPGDRAADRREVGVKLIYQPYQGAPARVVSYYVGYRSR